MSHGTSALPHSIFSHSIESVRNWMDSLPYRNRERPLYGKHKLSARPIYLPKSKLWTKGTINMYAGVTTMEQFLATLEDLKKGCEQNERIMLVLLVRHGISTSNEISGSRNYEPEKEAVDSDLTAAGRQGADMMGTLLLEETQRGFPRVEAIFSSAMTRTLETAARLNRYGARTTAYEFLRDRLTWHPGNSRNRATVLKSRFGFCTFPKIIDHVNLYQRFEIAAGRAISEEDIYAKKVRGGVESSKDLRIRMRKFAIPWVLKTALDSGCSECIMVVSHGSAIRAMLESFGFKRTGMIENAEIIPCVIKVTDISLSTVARKKKVTRFARIFNFLRKHVPGRFSSS